MTKNETIETLLKFLYEIRDEAGHRDSNETCAEGLYSLLITKGLIEPDLEENESFYD